MRVATPLGAVLIAALSLAPIGDAVAACADVFRFEANARLGVVDIAGLKPSSQPDDTLSDRWLVVREYWPTARPVREGWTALAVVYGTTDGIAVDTVGGVLWTRKPEGFREGAGATFAETTEFHEARFAGATTAAACPEGFLVRLDKTGRLTAGGKAIGVVFPEAAR